MSAGQVEFFADSSVGEPALSTAGNGGGIGTIDTDQGGGWEEFFEFENLKKIVNNLIETVAAQEIRIMELEGRIESSQFLGTDQGFATFIPRNRGGQL